MNSSLLAVLAATIIITTGLVFWWPAKDPRTRIIRWIEIVTPVVATVGVIYELYLNQMEHAKDTALTAIDLADSAWMRIREFLISHTNTTRTLYHQMFPEEAALLGAQSYEDDTGPITPDEIQVAHYVAQGVENYLTINEVRSQDGWETVFARMFRSDRLYSIWQVIRADYDPATQELIERLRKTKWS